MASKKFEITVLYLDSVEVYIEGLKKTRQQQIDWGGSNLIKVPEFDKRIAEAEADLEDGLKKASSEVLAAFKASVRIYTHTWIPEKDRKG